MSDDNESFQTINIANPPKRQLFASSLLGGFSLLRKFKTACPKVANKMSEKIIKTSEYFQKNSHIFSQTSHVFCNYSHIYLFSSETKNFKGLEIPFLLCLLIISHLYRSVLVPSSGYSHLSSVDSLLSTANSLTPKRKEISMLQPTR